MARMYARKHGKSGSKQREKKKKKWIDFDKDEIKKLILKLYKEGHSCAMIGTILRDQYGIPDVSVYGIKISDVVPKSEFPEDMFNLMKKAVAMHRHLEQNKSDGKNRHDLQLIESKIRRLGKYYSRKNKIPKNWKYNIEKVKLLVR